VCQWLCDCQKFIFWEFTCCLTQLQSKALTEAELSLSSEYQNEIRVWKFTSLCASDSFHSKSHSRDRTESVNKLWFSGLELGRTRKDLLASLRGRGGGYFERVFSSMGSALCSVVCMNTPGFGFSGRDTFKRAVFQSLMAQHYDFPFPEWKISCLARLGECDFRLETNFELHKSFSGRDKLENLFFHSFEWKISRVVTGKKFPLKSELCGKKSEQKLFCF